LDQDLEREGMSREGRVERRVTFKLLLKEEQRLAYNKW